MCTTKTLKCLCVCVCVCVFEWRSFRGHSGSRNKARIVRRMQCLCLMLDKKTGPQREHQSIHSQASVNIPKITTD